MSVRLSITVTWLSPRATFAKLAGALLNRTQRKIKCPTKTFVLWKRPFEALLIFLPDDCSRETEAKRILWNSLSSRRNSSENCYQHSNSNRCLMLFSSFYLFLLNKLLPAHQFQTERLAPVKRSVFDIFFEERNSRRDFWDFQSIVGIGGMSDKPRAFC